MLSSLRSICTIEALSHPSIYPLLGAAASPAPELAPVPAPTLFGAQLRDVLIVMGAAAILGLTLFLYIYITRRDRRTNSQTGARAIYRAEKRKRSDDDSSKRKFRKRRRHREEFTTRNPTLGETGGLPPLRTDEPVEPAS
jgi:hypothetical protein